MGTAKEAESIRGNQRIISLSLSVIAAGVPDTTLTLTGTNFLSASKVNLNGTSLAISFVSSTQSTATIPSASLVQAAGDQITVTNPSPGGGTSAAQTLAVTVIESLTIMATPKNGGPGNGSLNLPCFSVATRFLLWLPTAGRQSELITSSLPRRIGTRRTYQTKKPSRVEW